MAKTITLTYEGNTYNLEFTRKSIEKMEQKGFNIASMESKPMTTLPLLFAGAFMAHHPTVKREVVDNIFAKMKNKDDLIHKLAEMYNEPFETLLSEPEENEGNLDWGANW